MIDHRRRYDDDPDDEATDRRALIDSGWPADEVAAMTREQVASAAFAEFYVDESGWA
jgi:hypothetical protein